MNKNKTLIIVLSSLAGLGLLLMWGLYSLLFPTTTYLKYGVLDRKGQFVIPPQFDYITESSDGSFMGDNYAFDSDWRLYYSCWYTRNGALEGCFQSKGDPPRAEVDIGLRQSDLGYIGEQNQSDKDLVIQAQDDWSGYKLGFQNKQGQWVIQPQRWDFASDFSQGLAYVWIKGEPYGKWGIINTKGEYVLKPTCAHIWPFENDRAKCQVAFTETRFIFSKPEVDEALKGE